MTKVWPLGDVRPEILKPPHAGSFAAKRKFDIHTGVDLYCEEGTPVYAIEDGTVVSVEEFTGFEESPWWHDTYAVLVEGESGVLCYGEITPIENLQTELKAGDLIGHVKTVLKKDKGKPMTMLHFERYKPGTTEAVWWKLEDEMPENLLDPTGLLESL